MSDPLHYKQSQSTASLRRVYFTAVNNTDVTDYLQLSDMSTFTIYLSKNGGTPAIPSGTTISQISSSLQKGAMYLEMNATDFDTLGRCQIVITNPSGSKAMRRRTINIVVASEDASDVANANVQKWLGTVAATPSTAGVPHVRMVDIAAATITNASIADGAISTTKIADATLTIAKFGADTLKIAFSIMDMGTAQAGSSTTIQLATSAVTVDSAYKDALVYIYGGTGAPEIGQIDSFVGATRTATMKRAWAVNPNNASQYVVLAAGSPGAAPSAAANAAAVWAQLLEGSAQAGDLMRLFASVLAGIAQGFDTGDITFKSLDGSKVRLSVTTNATGRIASVEGDLT